MAISVAFVCPPVCPSVAYIVHLTVLEAAMTVVDCTAPLNRYTCYGAIEVVAIIIIIIIVWCGKTRMVWLRDGEKSMSICSAILT